MAKVQRSPDVEQLIVENMKPQTCIDCGKDGWPDVSVLGGRIDGFTVRRRLECICGTRWLQVIDRRASVERVQ